MNNKILLVAALFFSLFILSCASVQGGDDSNPAGIYAGVIPAADCPGISVVVILNDNGTYKWDAATKIVTLDSRDLPVYYRLGKQSLTQLDIEGKDIKSDFAKMYILRKI